MKFCHRRRPHLVKRGGLGVSHHVPVQRRGGKTASLLRGNVSISHLEVFMLPTSPNVAKSPDYLRMSAQSLRTAREHPAEPTFSENDQEPSSKFSLRIWLAKPPLSRGAPSGASLSMPLLALPVRERQSMCIVLLMVLVHLSSSPFQAVAIYSLSSGRELALSFQCFENKNRSIKVL
jgi:hypothetical protein